MKMLFVAIYISYFTLSAVWDWGIRSKQNDNCISKCDQGVGFLLHTSDFSETENLWISLVIISSSQYEQWCFFGLQCLIQLLGCMNISYQHTSYAHDTYVYIVQKLPSQWGPKKCVASWDDCQSVYAWSHEQLHSSCLIYHTLLYGF